MLSVERLTAGYGGADVLNGIDLDIAAGEVAGILGRNGSGKSTLIKAIVGLLPRHAGSVRLDGEPILGLATHRIARRGVAYVPQGRGIFPRLTVEENLLSGTRATSGRHSDIPEQVFGYFPILRKRLGQYGGTMSGGEQQMLAIGRALCGRPRLMLMDEPSDGVQPNIVEMLAELIPAMARENGLSVVLVEQNVDLAIAASGTCMVMEKGRIVKTGQPSEFADPEVLRKYLAI